MRLLRKRLSYSRGIVGDHIFLFTANSTIRNNGNLVMGAGCARTVRDTYQGIDKSFGKVINHMAVFNIQIVQWGEQWIGAFQTKIDWQADSPLDVVAGSIDELTRIALLRPKYTFHLPCPAINHGGKTEKEILPLLAKLPDNVIVYLD